MVIEAASADPDTKQPLWTVDELVAATGGRLVGDCSKPLNGVSIDSRTIEDGDVFYAIIGENSNGHDYVVAAFDAGAGIAVVSKETAKMRKAGPLLVVDDTLTALGALGTAARERSTARIIGVTGSVGKTSTKEALRIALSASAPTHASPSSYNNHWGVPLSLARMPRQTTYGVFEIGMNHSGEITPLTRMVRPHIAIITQIAEVHLGHFASLDEIADAKAEIFAGVEPDGAAVIVRDSPYYDHLASAAKAAGVTEIVGFGRDEKAEARLGNAVLHSTCSCVTASILGEDVCYKTGAPGEHIVMNSLAVLAAAKLAGGDLAKAAISLAALSAPKGRGVRSKLAAPDGNFILIDESYNANPTSVRAALKLLAQSKPQKHGRRIAVLGDMLELGEHAAELHAGLADDIAEANVDCVFVCGKDMQHLWMKLPQAVRSRYAKTSAELSEPLLAAIGAGDVVMIKGSLGSRMGPLVDAIQNKFKPAADIETG
ncbi:MAG: UDP-N-acetylmuramoylalanyl-D-glutamyl-2,6-diaminopimelate--D-alanyl-D-alanine ligase [Hyphomicrobiales bacterium]|nr:UDP-N-acetylmuramoylalanyl-D-glutamyl-2,6-diaminopimelate--D-alanyl-D-alanine ligase [Hyphomicrobiales bacterium]